jgi:hypothetical protein
MIFWSLCAFIWFGNIEKMLLQMTSVSLQPIPTLLYIILKNFSVNFLSKMFVLTEIIDCIFLLFSKILSSVLS